MPPRGLVHQIKLARGLAENGAVLCLLSGLIIIAATLVALYFITIYRRNDSQMPWYYLIIIGCVELFGLLIVTRFVASGAAYGVLSKRDQVCEMWQRRLDQFILTGSWDAENNDCESSCRVGQVSEKGRAPDIEEPFKSYYVKTNKAGEALLTPLAIVTGANSGVGYETAETLLQCGFKVVLACRNIKAAEEARTKMLMNCRERVWARYREAFQCDKSPLRDDDNCHSIEEIRPVTLDDGSTRSVKEVHWAGVKQRARALMAALPLNVAVVPLDLGSIPSINDFVKVMVQEHFHGVRGEDLISGPSQLWAQSGGGDRDKTSGEARPASEMPNTAKSGTNTVPDNCEQPVPPLKCFHDGIRVLVNNAGCYNPTYGGLPPFASNVEGLVGVNYIGPTLLTNALLKGIKGVGIDSLPGILSSSRSSSPSTSPGELDRTEGSKQTDRASRSAVTDISRRLPLRIINVSSVAHTWALEGSKEVGTVDSSAEIGAETSQRTDESLVSRILKVLEAISTPEATPSNNTVLKRHIKNTYGLSKLGAIALTRAVCELDSQCRSSKNLAVEDKTSPQMCLPKTGAGLNITTYSLHPGAVRTAVFRSAPKAVQLVIETAGLLLFKTPQEGAALQVYLSLYVDHEQLSHDSLTRSVIKHEVSHQNSQKVNRPLFASSIPPRNPSPTPPNGHYFTDSGAVDDQKSHLASPEALSHAAMLAMNRWALVACKEHIKEWPAVEDTQQSLPR